LLPLSILVAVKGLYFLERRADKKLGEDVRNNLVRLFTQHSARVVQNDKSEYRESRSFDYAVATVSTSDLNLRFVRVRGEFAVDISIPNSHPTWDSLDSALLWLDMKRGFETKLEIPTSQYGLDWASLDWLSIDQFLVEKWELLKSAAGGHTSQDG